MMKRWFAVVIACMLLLTGCGGKTTTPSDSSPKQEDVESEALASFRQEIGDENAVLAVAYLGYVDLTGYEDLTVYLEANGFYEIYPFLSELTDKQFLQQEGEELYLIVPAAKGISLTVFDCSVDEAKSVLARGAELLRLDADEPVILQGNVSEIVPNLWVAAEAGGKELVEYTPSLSGMDGSVVTAAGVYDCTDYGHLLSIWSGPVDEVPIFCNTWYAQTADGDGLTRSLKLSLWYDGTAEYSYGIPNSDLLESFEGSWTEFDGVLTLDLYGGPVSYDGSPLPGEAYSTVCSFEWDYQSRHLYLHHTDNGVLLYGTEGASFDFLPFDSYLLAGTWSASAPVRDWTYDLSLLENGECWFTISESDEELAFYEGWWYMSEDHYVHLDLGLNSGQHPENPEMEAISGTYLAERHDNTMELTFKSGHILTLGMEEHGWDAFWTVPTSCVSVHYAADLGVAWDEYDWVIVDDTVPVEAIFCTMVPVDDFTVVSLSLQDVSEDGSIDFDATELFDYGTLTPESPLCVILTDYGTIPSYGVSFTDPNGAEKLYGVTVSGVDGSLELVEIN